MLRDALRRVDLQHGVRRCQLVAHEPIPDQAQINEALICRGPVPLWASQEGIDVDGLHVIQIHRAIFLHEMTPPPFEQPGVASLL